MLEVDSDTALVAVEAQQRRRFSLEFGICERVGAGPLSYNRWLDLQDLGTEIAETHAAEWAGEHLRKIEDTEPGQGTGPGLRAVAPLLHCVPILIRSARNRS